MTRKHISEKATKVKIELLKQGVTQRELAKKINTTDQYLSDILTDRRSGKKYWSQIEQVLGLNFQEDEHYLKRKKAE